MSSATQKQSLEDRLPDDLNLDSVKAPVQIWARLPEFSKSKYFHEYLTRLTNGRDMHTYITAEAETGVGKTTLAFVIARMCDLRGWTIDQATLDPREYMFKYDQVPKGSWLMLDEIEQAADKRRSMSTDNLELGHAFATQRYRQIFGIMTLPTKKWLDDRIS